MSRVCNGVRWHRCGPRERGQRGQTRRLGRQWHQVGAASDVVTSWRDCNICRGAPDRRQHQRPLQRGALGGGGQGTRDGHVHYLRRGLRGHGRQRLAIFAAGDLVVVLGEECGEVCALPLHEQREGLAERCGTRDAGASTAPSARRALDLDAGAEERLRLCIFAAQAGVLVPNLVTAVPVVHQARQLVARGRRRLVPRMVEHGDSWQGRPARNKAIETFQGRGRGLARLAGG
mmetsp:Transcript_62287/g.185569  ORF Transcript_62287/g.185569 Transcript_62287/m.185569 type:complete len:232 (+) Transcript_62287:120-815(+)